MRHAKLTILILTLTFFLVGCGGYHTEGEIRAKIDSSIPIGSSKKDVIKFLNDSSITVIDDSNKWTLPNGKECEWVPASLETWGVWGTRYIVIDFFFDQQNETLVEYRVHSFYPGWAEL